MTNKRKNGRGMRRTGRALNLKISGREVTKEGTTSALNEGGTFFILGRINGGKVHLGGENRRGGKIETGNVIKLGKSEE